MTLLDVPAIRAEGLTKRYGDTQALAGVDLTVRAGSILGLLGPNGAGKSTTVRVLATLTRPDGGRAVVAGYDVVREPEQVRAHIGLAGQHAAVDEKLAGRDNLRMFGRLYHLSRSEARARAEELLEEFDLLDAAERVVKTYSGGMRRRLDIAASLIIAPPVLFLDEPTTGLDPRSRNAVWAMIRRLAERGATVLLTTQTLDEADNLADDIAVVDGGREIANGTPDELKTRVGQDRVDVVVADPRDRAAAVDALRRATGVEPQLSGEQLSVPANGSRTLTTVVRELDAAGVATDDIALRRPTLDDVFLHFTGRQAEPQSEEEQAT